MLNRLELRELYNRADCAQIRVAYAAEEALLAGEFTEELKEALRIWRALEAWRLVEYHQRAGDVERWLESTVQAASDPDQPAHVRQMYALRLRLYREILGGMKTDQDVERVSVVAAKQLRETEAPANDAAAADPVGSPDPLPELVSFGADA